MARKRSMVKDRPMHKTASILLDTVVGILDTTPVDMVTLAEVLEKSGVSHGSLYHHFEDFSDLVEQATVHRYARRLLDSLTVIRELLDCSDAADFRARSIAIVEATITRERQKNRQERVEVLGAIQAHPRLVDKIAELQEVTDEQAELYREFQARGWMRSDLDPHAMSAFVQAMIVGRIVDDVSERPIDDSTWKQVVLPAFVTVLFGD